MLTKQQMDKLTHGIMNLRNHSHLTCIGGWRPADLAKQTGMPTAISFGPGIQKAIAEGTINKEEFVRKIKEMGLEYLD